MEDLAPFPAGVTAVATAAAPRPPLHIYKTGLVWLVRAEDTGTPRAGRAPYAPRPVDAECGVMSERQKEICDVPKAGAALLAG